MELTFKYKEILLLELKREGSRRRNHLHLDTELTVNY